MALRQAAALLTSRSPDKAASALHVCVVGAGLAGLACAAAAAAAGSCVDVIDERSALATHQTHVNVVPNLLRDLVALGVGADCVKAGFPYRAIRVMDARGRNCCELPTPRLAPVGYPEALGMAHGELVGILAKAAQDRGARLFLGTRVEGLGWNMGRATLTLSDGREITPDLTLLASGALSPLRDAALQIRTAPVCLGHEWTYTQSPRPRGFDHASLVLDSAGQHAFIVPISPSTIGIALTSGDASRPVPPVLQPLLARLAPDTPRIVRPLLAGFLPAPWHRGNLICVGECAHTLPPHFGQSAAQAVEDAIVLQQLLAQGLSPAAVAERFSERRHARARNVYQLVTQAARAQLSPNEETDLRALYLRLSRLVAEPA